MNKDMRKMYSEKEIAKLVEKANNRNDVFTGTKLYFTKRKYTVRTGQTVAEGCETELTIGIVSSLQYYPSTITPSYFITDDVATSTISFWVFIGNRPYRVTSLTTNMPNPSPNSHLIFKYNDAVGTEITKELDVFNKYAIDDVVKRLAYQ